MRALRSAQRCLCIMGLMTGPATALAQVNTNFHSQIGQNISSNAIDSAFAQAMALARLGVAGGAAPLDANALVPASALGNVGSASYVASGASLSRTASARASDIYRLVDFGSGGRVPCSDNAADDGAFNAAAAAASSGGTILLPRGSTCHLASTWVLGKGVSLEGQGDSTTLVPLAALAAMIRVTSGLTRLSGFSLSNSNNYATSAIQIGKAVDIDNLPIEIERVNAYSFTTALRIGRGDAVHVTGGLFVNNGTAVSFEGSSVNDVLSRLYVLGGNGVDALLPTSANDNYGHVEGLMMSQVTILPGASGAFCVRLRGVVHFVFGDGMCDQVQNGSGFVFDGSGYALHSVDIHDSWIGTNTNAAQTGSAIQITGGGSSGGGVDHIHLRGLTLAGWRSVPIAIDGGTGGTARGTIEDVSFYNTAAANDISIANATFNLIAPDYDVGTGLTTGANATVKTAP